MDLKLYLDPVTPELTEQEFSNDSFVQSVYVNEDKIPDLDGMDLALVGLRENRGNIDLNQTGVNEIRKKLYTLKRGEGMCNIVDLGDIRNGIDLEETYKKIKIVCQSLISKKVLPILIGGTHDLDIGQFWAYEEEDKLVTVLNVDSRLDLEKDQDETRKKHLHKIFTHEPNYLFNYNQLGHQSYLVNPSSQKTVQQLRFRMTRLGEMREDFKKVEPIIREADMLSFDLSAIQKMYCPGGQDSEVFGLTGEEACQIMWYAGINDKLSSVGIYEYNPDKDTQDHQSAMVIATMVWYFVEGFKNRKGEKGFQTNDYVQYVVSMGVEPETITFYKSRLSDKWWMEVPNSNHTGIYDRSFIVPCDHADYEEATKGEVPERWINVFSKNL